LSDPHTFANFRTAHLLPELMDRSRFESWEKEGKTDLFTRANEKAKALLSSHEVKKTLVAEEALTAL
jgi:trimethylamine--corrinoid protein Co-methyltransferase